MSGPSFDDPDIAYTTWLEYPYARIRTEIGIDRGDVEWFIARLEYNTATGLNESDDWRQVAGFDHHPQADWGHDIIADGLHLDIYREGEKTEVARGFPQVDLANAVDFCQRFLRKNADELIEQFESWHGLRS